LSSRWRTIRPIPRSQGKSSNSMMGAGVGVQGRDGRGVLVRRLV
jgi:hypothetical protein